MTDYGDNTGPVQTDPGERRQRDALERAVDRMLEAWFADGHPGLTDAINALVDARSDHGKFADVDWFARRPGPPLDAGNMPGVDPDDPEHSGESGEKCDWCYGFGQLFGDVGPDVDEPPPGTTCPICNGTGEA